jgi:FAD/FMN-containing dehydrogenase
MQIKNKKKAFIIFSTALISLISLYTSKELVTLAADPKGQFKDCNPLESKNYIQNLRIEETNMLVKWSQRGGTVNDASCLNQTAVYGVVDIRSEDDIKIALEFARENDLKVSVAAVRHSMGGQAFLEGAMILNMQTFNNIQLNKEQMTVTVQSGATWHQIQNKIHPTYAIKAMQSSDIFSVGGSISVNAHGMDHHVGAIKDTIKSMRIMMPNGEVKTITPTNDPEHFNLIVGGYGLFGIIIDAEIEIQQNEVYETQREIISYKEFPEFFAENIDNNKDYGLFYAHLSTAPSSFLDELLIYRYKKVTDGEFVIGDLDEVGHVKSRRILLGLAKKGKIFQELKWMLEREVEKRIESCTVDRNNAIKSAEGCFVSRNDPMHDSVKYLNNTATDNTDILHEYFIPRDVFVNFVDEMRVILQSHNAITLNASVRVVHKEDNFLSYATEDSFSIVLYLNQKTDEQGNKDMELLTSKLIDLTNRYGGRFFLPYQLHYDHDKLVQSYPEIIEFFDLKLKYDPEEILTNKFYEKYK